MQPKAKKNKFRIVILVILAIAIAVGVFLVIKNMTKPPQTGASLDVSEATKQKAEKSDTERAKGSENKNSSQGNENPTEQQPSRPPGPVGINISSAEQSGDMVYINGLVSGTASGTCKLVVSKGDKKIEKTAPIGMQVSYYICQGFSISSSEFATKGEWTATIEVTSPNGGATSEPRKINIQ